MMRTMMLLSFLLVNQFIIGQVKTNNPYALVDNKMAKIPDSLTTSTEGIANFIKANFKSETEKIRAVFYWTATNIKYDVPNMFEPNYLDSPEEKIANTLKTRKGVCIHYAEVFNAIANKADIKSYIVPGYTKQNGKIAAISHAWCAAAIDGEWYLFDPTWGSGYVDGQKFVKKLNTTYFKVEPQKMILTHMPFDYLWQFLINPITNQEFSEGKEDPKKVKVLFDFKAEINRYEGMSESDRAFESSKRIEKNGLTNTLIIENYTNVKKQFAVFTQNKNVEKFNALVTYYNEAVSYLNDFEMYKFKKFKPALPDEELKNMMENIKTRFKKCNDEVYTIGNLGPENKGQLTDLKRGLATNQLEVDKLDTFVKDYLSKGGLGRKLMFVSSK